MQDKNKPKHIILPDPYSRTVVDPSKKEATPEDKLAWINACSSGSKSKKTKQFAKGLLKRKTAAEIKAESILKSMGIAFVSQAPIGPFVADIMVKSKKLIIEIDGSIHQSKYCLGKDLVRDDYLRSRGFAIVRLSNKDILGPNAEIWIKKALKSRGRKLTHDEREALNREQEWGRREDWRTIQDNTLAKRAQIKERAKKYGVKLNKHDLLKV